METVLSSEQATHELGHRERHLVKTLRRMWAAIGRDVPRRLLTTVSFPDFVNQESTFLMTVCIQYEANEASEAVLYTACQDYISVWREYASRDRKGIPL